MINIGKKPVVRLELSPYVNLGKRKIKQRVKSIGKGGEPVIYKDKDGKNVYQTEEADVSNLATMPGTIQYLCAAPTRTGLATGLNHLVENPYCDYDENDFMPEWGARKLKGKSKVLLQVLLEYQHNVPEGYYRSDFGTYVSESYDDIDTPFFAKPHSKIAISNNSVFLDLNNAEDEVRYYMLLQRKDVAKNLKQLEEDPGIYRFVITNDQEKDTTKASSEKLVTRAGVYLMEIDDLNDDTICDMAIVLGASVSIKRDQAFSYVKRHYEDSTNQLKEFIGWYKKYTDLATRNEFYAAARLAQYVEANIIRRRDNSYFWDSVDPETNATENYTWSSREHIIKTFLTAPETQKQVEIIKGKYNYYLKSRQAESYDF